MTLSSLEAAICEDIARRRDDLISLTSRLIEFDTTTYEPGEPTRDEAALQAFVAQRLRDAGAETESWEPRAEELVPWRRQIPYPLTFEGRPQLSALFRGRGGGKSLLLFGHIDVVPSAPVALWKTDPARASLVGGKLYGRGACDMKGGIASMIVASEAIMRHAGPLAGDLRLVTGTDEESSGGGSIAAVTHGITADAVIVPEPSGFDAWVACRGSLNPTITVMGRAGHTEIAQPHWQEGGAVNAIEKAMIVVDALRRLRDEWRHRADHRHPLLSPGDLVPSFITAGEWAATYPSSCRIVVSVTYLPGHADGGGWGTIVEDEITRWIERATSADPWLRDHPPELEWGIDAPPIEVSAASPIVDIALAAAADVGRPGRVAGLDAWYDGATFARSLGIPAIGFGPPSIQNAHTIDEWVDVNDLVSCAQALSLAAMRFCASKEPPR
jgi:acetylornithine deacetylase